MGDQYDRIYGHGSEIAAALRENDEVRARYPIQPKATEPPPEEPAVQHYAPRKPNILDPETQKLWDDWCNTLITNRMKRWRIDGTSFENAIVKNHIKPVVDLLNETRRDILALRKELGLPLPKDDARLKQTTSAEDHQRETLRAKRRRGEAKQSDPQAEDEFMEQCISNLEDQGVDDAEAVCQALWEEQGGDLA